MDIHYDTQKCWYKYGRGYMRIKMLLAAMCAAAVITGQTGDEETVLELPAVTAEAESPRDSSHASPDEEEMLEMPAVTAEGETGGEGAAAAPADAAAEQEEVVDELPPIETMPALTHFVEAAYPVDVYSQGIEGAVLMTLLVSDSGTVDSVAVDRSLHPTLDSNAVEAARQFTFSPAIAGGEPVPVLIQYEYRYSLEEVVSNVDEYVNFSGRLIESGTRKPLADVMTVITFIDTTDSLLEVPFSVYRERLGEMKGQYLEEDRLVTLTDSGGHFTFKSLPNVRIKVSAPIPGYEQLNETEVITPEKELLVDYYIRRVNYSDYEVVVYGKTEEKEVSRRQLTVTEVKKIPGLGGDAIRVVQAMPGVSRPSFGSGEVVVRGAPTWDSKFYLDGVTLPLLYHFGGLKSVYPSDALDGIDFYPGGFGTRYGGATAGAIEITGRTAKQDRLHGKLDLSTLDGSFFIEGPVCEGVSIQAFARRSFVGEIIDWYLERSELDIPLSLAPFYWDYLVRTDFSLNERHDLYVTLFGSRDSVLVYAPTVSGGSEDIDEATEYFQAALMFHMGLIGWDWNNGGKLRNSFRYALTRFDNSFSAFGYVKSVSNSFDHHLRNEFSYEHTERFKVNAGIDAYAFLLDMTLAVPRSDRLVLRDTVDNWLFGVLGGYANCEYRPVEKLLIIPGLRYDYFPELDYRGAQLPEFWDYHSFNRTTSYSAEPSARLTARYEVAGGHTVKGALGNYSQTPQPVGQAIMEGWGDPHLPATKAAHYVLGYEWQITDLLHLDVQGYINNQWNIPRMGDSADIADNANLEDVRTEDLWLADKEGRMRGVELMLRHDQGERFFGWLAYTLSRSERKDPHSDGYHVFSEDETHHLQAVASWRLPKQWEAGCRLRYVTGKPTRPLEGVGEDETRNYRIPYFGDYSEDHRMDPFVQLDVRVDKKFVMDKWMLSLYVDIQNLSWLFYKSPEMLVWNDLYTEQTVVSSFILPAVGLTAEF